LTWTIEYHPRVEKDLKAIDRPIQREILDYMDARIASNENPRRFGKSLRHEFRGYGVTAAASIASFAKFRINVAWYLF